MTAISASSYSGRVLSRLGAWPALHTANAHCGVGIGVGVGTGSRQIMHLHGADEADLRLTRPVIDRLRGALDESGRIQADSDGDWVSVRLEGERDVDLLLSLVSVAIQANAGPAGPERPDATGDACRTGGTRVVPRAGTTADQP